MRARKKAINASSCVCFFSPDATFQLPRAAAELAQPVDDLLGALRTHDLLAERAPGEAPFMEVNMAAERALAELPKPTIAVKVRNASASDLGLGTAQLSQFSLLLLQLCQQLAALDGVKLVAGQTLQTLLRTGNLVLQLGYRT